MGQNKQTNLFKKDNNNPNADELQKIVTWWLKNHASIWLSKGR